jgi:hypothetical protein
MAEAGSQTLDSAIPLWGGHPIAAVCFFLHIIKHNSQSLLVFLKTKLCGGNEMGWNRIMSSDHQNGNVTDDGAQTEQALRASELGYRRLFEAAHESHTLATASRAGGALS